MKILNLDKLDTSTGRQLTIDGKNYPIHSMSVEDFIATSRKVDEIIEKNAGVAEQLESTIDAILRQVPDLSREKLAKFPPQTLQTIVQFIQGEDVEGAEEAAAEAAGK